MSKSNFSFFFARLDLNFIKNQLCRILFFRAKIFYYF